MESFRYRAARDDGRVVAGLVQAESSGQATALLVGRGLHPLSVERAEPAGTARAAGRPELAVVFRSISALAAAGVPLERAVAATERLARGALGRTLADARERLREGRSFAQALEAGEGVVPPLVVGMLRAGERGSQLGRALEQVAEQLEREAELAGRVRQALAYPAVLAIVGAGSVGLITTSVVPRFAELLSDLGSELPASTRLLLDISTFVTGNAVALTLGLAALGVGALQWHARPAARLAVARLLLALPVVGTVRRALATARWAQALAGMLATGMPLLAALDAAREAAGDPAFGERLDRARERVAEGQGLAASLEREAALLPGALQLVVVGESSGQLARMAERAAGLAAAEADRALKGLVSLLEPALVVVFGGLVAFVAAALLQAVYSLRPGGP
jgi:general secretion pathway protein F